MNRERLTSERAVDKFFEALTGPGASRAEVDRSADRMLRYLEGQYEKLPAGRRPSREGERRHPWRWVAVAAVGMVFAAGLMLLRVDTGTVGSVEGGTITAFEKGNARSISQGGMLNAHSSLRVGDGPAMVSLADGSRVELSAKSDFSVVRVSDGIELRLGKGNIIVTAAKQKSGHLYVRTPDCSVSVTGTVFSVRAEDTGSRVSVFEGQVRVAQRDMTYTLSRGEQLATSPVLGAPGLEGELQWSRNAASVLALLQAPELSTVVPAGAESIEGIVTNTATGGPLPGVTVLVAPPQSPRVLFEVKSGNDGRFKIERVPPGVYVLVGSATGFWATSGPGEIKLASGQSVRGLRLAMSQVASVSGRVADENGQPVSGLSLMLRRKGYEGGQRTLEKANTGASGGITNERGEYEFSNVLPGRYYIKTIPDASHEAAIYYPGTLDADDSLPVELEPGTVLTGINLTLPNVKFYSIRFKAPKDSMLWFDSIFRPSIRKPAPGSPAKPVAPSPVLYPTDNQPGQKAPTFKVTPNSPPGFTLQRMGKLLDRDFGDGSVVVYPGPSRLKSLGNDEYVLSRVPPGKYHLQLSWNGGLQERGDGTFGQSRASVDADFEIADKDVDLGKLASKSKSLSIPVHFTFADGVPSEVLLMTTSTLPFGGGVYLNSLSPAPLRLINLAEGAYTLAFRLVAPDRYVSIARYGGQDVLSDPLVLDGTDRGTLEIVVDGPSGSVEGIVRDAKGNPVQNINVVLATSPYRSPGASVVHSGVTDQIGAFRFSDIAPGDYRVYSSESTLANYGDPDWLRENEGRGTSVTVRKGQTAAANVRVIPR